tara:strand:- start:292 stop:492 length:201 start_codon:yes stop_codon:yes gene_type:complete
MKEVDDTPVPESESVAVDMLILDTWFALWLEEIRLEERLADLEKRVANLEARKPPQDTNPDPEWYA